MEEEEEEEDGIELDRGEDVVSILGRRWWVFAALPVLGPNKGCPPFIFLVFFVLMPRIV